MGSKVWEAAGISRNPLEPPLFVILPHFEPRQYSENPEPASSISKDLKPNTRIWPKDAPP